jgi:hypothetical protein
MGPRLAAIVAVLLLIPATAANSVPVDESVKLVDVACPTTQICATVGPNGLFGTLDVSQGGWANVVKGPLDAISCPGTSFCVAVGPGGTIVANARPGAVYDWKTVRPDPDVDLSDVSCVGSFCAAVGNTPVSHDASTFRRVVMTTTDPIAGDWKETTIPANSPLQAFGGISCTPGLCTAVGGANVVASTDPAGGADAWTSYEGSQTWAGHACCAIFFHVECAGAILCVAPDGVGHLRFTTSPNAPNPWGVSNTGSGGVGPRIGQGRVSCPSTSVCVTSDPLSTNDPVRGPWFEQLPTNGIGYTAVSCPTTTFCVGVDKNGNADTFVPVTRASAERTLKKSLLPAVLPKLATLRRQKKFAFELSTNTGSYVSVTWSWNGQVIADGAGTYQSPVQELITLVFRNSALRKLKGQKKARITAKVATNGLTVSRSFTLKQR